MGYYEASVALREQWMADDYDEALAQIRGRKNGLALVNNGAKFLKYRPWGVNPDGSVNNTGGSSSSWAATPGQASQTPSGDLDLRVRVASSDWVNGGNASFQTLISKWTGTAATSAWRLGIQNGVLTLALSDGTSMVTVNASAALALTNGAATYFKVTWRKSDGRVQFFTSSDGAVWTQIGTDRTLGAGITLAVAQTTEVRIGAFVHAGVYGLPGRLFFGEVRNGMDGPVVAKFDASKINTHHGPFYNDGLGNQWYGLGSAAWGDHFQPNGVAANYAVTPTSTVWSDMNETGDVRILMAADWTSAQGSAGAWDGFGGQWLLRWGGGSIALFAGSWAGGGIATSANFSSLNVGPNGKPSWIRCTWQRDRGDGQYEVKFFYSDDAVSWTQLGATKNGVTAAKSVATASVFSIGAYGTGGTTYPTTGRIFRVEARSSINGPKVADVRFDKPLKWSNPVAGTATVTDDFSEANGTNISGKTTDTAGKAWTLRSGTATVQSGKYVASVGARSTVDVGSRNAAAQVTATLNGVNTAGLLLRYTDESNFLVAELASGTLYVYRKVGGVSTPVGNPSVTLGATAVLRGVAVDDLVILYVDGVEKFRFTDATTGTHFGLTNNFVAGGSNAPLDDFTASPAGLYLDPQGNAWTINRSALQSRMKVVSNDSLQFANSSATSTERLATPDVAEIETNLGSTEYRIRVKLDSYADNTSQALFSKTTSSGTTAEGFRVRIGPNGNLDYFWSDGVAFRSTSSTVVLPLTGGVEYWLRITHEVNYDSAGSSRVRFYYAPASVTTPTVWTQVGVDRILANTGGVQDTGWALSIGGYANGGADRTPNGKIYEAQLWRGIPGVSASARLVANPKFTALTSYAPYKEPSYLAVPGGHLTSTPNDAALNVTGDLDIAMKLALDDWDGAGGYVNMMDRGWESEAAQGQWALGRNTTNLTFMWYDNAGVKQVYLLGGPAIVDGSARWLRATLDIDNGAGQHVVSIYQKIEDADAWTLVGSSTRAGVTTVRSSTGVTSIGRNFTGRALRAVIKNGIDGTAVFDADFTNLTDGQTSFVEATGKTVTINGTARIERRTWTFTRAALNARAELRTGRYAYLPGVVGNRLEAPNSTDLNIRGDLDLRARITPTAAADMAVVGIMSGNGLTKDSYLLEYTSTGTLRLRSFDGANRPTVASTVAVPYPVGSTFWARVTANTATNVGQFFTSLDGGTWTQLGANVVVPSFFYETIDSIRVGAYGTAAFENFLGDVHAIEVRDGINGTIVAAFDLADAMLMPVEPHNSFTDLYGNTWTVNRATGQTAFRTALVDRSMMLLAGGGAAVASYMRAAANALLDIGAADSMTVVLLGRFHPITPTAYVSPVNGRRSDGVGWELGVNASGTLRATNRDAFAVNDDVSGTSINIVNNGRRYLLAEVRDKTANQLRLEINGVVDAIEPGGIQAGSLDSDMPITIGGRYGDQTPASDGSVGFEFFGLAFAPAVMAPADYATLFDPDLELSIGPVGDIASAEAFNGRGDWKVKEDFAGLANGSQVASQPATTPTGTTPWITTGPGAFLVQDEKMQIVLGANMVADTGLKDFSFECDWTFGNTIGAGVTGFVFYMDPAATSERGGIRCWFNSTSMTMQYGYPAIDFVNIPGVNNFGGFTLQPNTTYHIKWVMEGMDIKLYIDGILRMNTTMAPSVAAYFKNRTGHGFRASANPGAGNIPLIDNIVISELPGTQLQMRMSTVGNLASGESFGYPDVLEHGEFFADDFPEPDGAALDPTQWTSDTNRVGGTRAVVSNRMVLAPVDQGGTPTSAVTASPVMADYKNIDLLFKFRRNGTNAMIVELRRSADGLSAYYMQIVPHVNGLFISKAVAGVSTQLAANNSKVFAQGVDYWARFRVVANMIYFRSWADGGSEPSTWEFVVTDAAVQAPGKVRFQVYRVSNGTSWEFDNIAIQDIKGMDLVGGIPSGEAIGGISYMRQTMSGITVPSSYVAPSLDRITMMMRNLGGLVNTSLYGGIQKLRMYLRNIGDIESEESVWDNEEDELLAGRFKHQHPYRVDATEVKL